MLAYGLMRQGLWTAVLVLLSAPLTLAFVPRTLHSAYPPDAVGLVMKWDLAGFANGAIPYWINPTIPAGFTPFEPTSSTDVVLARVHAAFQAWEVPTSRVKFRFAGFTDAVDAIDGKMVVSFSIAPARGGPIDTGCRAADRATPATGAAGVILPQTFAGQILECDPTVHPVDPQRATAWWVGDTAPPLTVQGQRGRLDLQGILTHEIGHVLGLDHTGTAETATMTIWNGAGESLGAHGQRTLSADDVIGVSTLYPTDNFLRDTGTIAGKVVRDQNGGSVFGAHVVAVDAATGVIVAGAVTGLLELGSDGMPRRFQLASGRYVIPGLPPGVYRVYAEPLDGPNSNFLGGVFGLSATQQYMEKDFAPGFFAGGVMVESGATTPDVDVHVMSRSVNAPNLDLVTWITEAGNRTDPVLVRPGSVVLMELAPGEHIVTDQGLVAGTQFMFFGPGVTIESAEARRTILLRVSVDPEAPIGPRLLQLTTPDGVAFLSGGLTVVPRP